MAIVAFSALVTYGMLHHSLKLPQPYWIAIGTALVLTAGLFEQHRLYQPWRGMSLGQELRLLTTAWLKLLLLLAAVAFMTASSGSFEPRWAYGWAFSGLLTLIVFRSLLRSSLSLARSDGLNRRQVVVVVASPLGLEVVRRLRGEKSTGFNVHGFFDDRSAQRLELTDDVPLLGSIADLPAYIEGHGIDQVWLAFPFRAEQRVRQILHQLRHSTVDIRLVPDIFGFGLLNHSVEVVARIPVINLSASPLTGFNRVVKALEDRLLAALFLVLAAPLLGLIALGVKLSSPGPVFYRQERIGYHGKPFTMLKFRSMPVDAESCSGPVWARQGENRATAFGAFLRKSSLDELPQLINVLRGEMSIVGPRPERPYFVERFKEEIPHYMKKHMVKAGITGLAQVSGWRGNTDLNKRIECDLYYIDNWSLWMDLRIILLTVWKCFNDRNAY